jgi:cation:H+ antiporter
MDTNLLMALGLVIAGLGLLAWSADRFVEGAAAVAGHFGLPPLLIGMVIVGFGTSAPEMVVSATAAWQGNPGIALGNAYGSNITNIALILGLTALIRPLAVKSRILRQELPILTAVTLLAGWQVRDGDVSRADALVLLGISGGLIAWAFIQGLRHQTDPLAGAMQQRLGADLMPLGRALLWLGVGLAVLIASSRMLVWGAVTIARAFGVSDLIIGLTIVAVGTSLPELASSLIAVRKGRHDIAMGNVLGSNLFNTLAVVGIAGAICPMTAEPAVFYRDAAVMTALTLLIFIIGYGFRGRPGRINRYEGGLLLAVYIGYTACLIASVIFPASV